MKLISPDTEQEYRDINLGAKPLVPEVSETGTPETGVRGRNASMDAESCALGTFAAAPEFPDAEITAPAKALEREDRRRATAPMVPEVAGLAIGLEGFFFFLENQKQPMAV